MNSWIPKNKVVRSAIAVIFLSIVLYAAGLWIVLNEIEKIQNLYANADSESFKEQKFLAIKAISDSNGGSIQTLRDFFIKKGDEVKFIEEIEAVAKAASVTFEISSIDVKTSTKDTFKEDVDVKVKLEGSWKDTLYFLDKLKKMPFGVSIENIDLDAGAQSGWSASVEIIVFREK